MASKKLSKVQVMGVQKRTYPSRYYVYVISVTWSEGSETQIYRRYSSFFEFHTKLLDSFPEEAGEGGKRIIPYLTGKSMFTRTNTRRFAEARMALINEYCQSLIKLPAKISESDIVKNFFDMSAEDVKPPTEQERLRKAPNPIKKAADFVMGSSEAAPIREIQNISQPMVLDQYKVLADYSKSNKGEVSVRKGDIVEVIERNQNGWWFVSADETQGWVPATYLEALDVDEDEEDTVQHIPEGANFVTTKPYKAAETDEISFDKGVVVQVLETNLDGWWRIRYQNKEGWAPAAYLVEAPSAEFSSKSASDVVSNTGAGGTKNGPPPPPPPTKGTSNTDAAKPVLPPPPPQPSQPSSSQQAEDMKKPPPPRVITDERSDRPTLRPKDDKGKVTAGKGIISALNTKLEMGPKSSEEVVSKVKHHDTQVLPSAKKQIAPVVPKPPEVPPPSSVSDKQFQAIDDFVGDDDPTFKMKKGDKVTVIEENESGWWFVKLSNGKEGWVPSTFITKASDSSLGTYSTPPKPSRNMSANPAPVSAPQPVVSRPSEPSKPEKPEPAASRGPVLPLKVTPSDLSSVSSNTSSTTNKSFGVSNSQNNASSSPPKFDKPIEQPQQPQQPQQPAKVPLLPPGAKPVLSSTKPSTSTDSPTPPILPMKRETAITRPDIVPKPVTVSSSDPPVFPLKRETISTKPDIVPKPLPNTNPSIALKPVLPAPVDKKAADSTPTPAVPVLPLKPEVVKRPEPAPAPVPVPLKPQTSAKPTIAPKTATSSSDVKSSENKSVGSGSEEYVAIDDYKAEDDTGLSFKAGDVFKVLEKSGEGWWFVSLKGKEGWIPSTFVKPHTGSNSVQSTKPNPAPPIANNSAKPMVADKKPLAPPKAPASSNMFVSVDNFSEEDGRLVFKKGEKVEVIEKADSGWWFVRVQSSRLEAWAPSTFLKTA